MGLGFGNTASHPSSPNFTRLKKMLTYETYPTPASTQINPGDLVLLNTATLAIMSAATWDTNIGTTQADVAPVFMGIALDQKLVGDPTTREIAVAIEGIAEFPCTALGAAHHVGEYVAADADGVHNLYDQIVALTATLANAIGKLEREAASGATFLQFYFASTLIFGKVQAAV